MNDYNEIKIEIIDKFRDFNNLTNYGVKINKDDHDFKGKVDFLVHENRLTIRDFFSNGLDKNEESQALKILSDRDNFFNREGVHNDHSLSSSIAHVDTLSISFLKKIVNM